MYQFSLCKDNTVSRPSHLYGMMTFYTEVPPEHYELTMCVSKSCKYNQHKRQTCACIMGYSVYVLVMGIGHIVEITPHGNKGSGYSTYPIPWLLMACDLNRQSIRHGGIDLVFPEYSGFSTRRIDPMNLLEVIDHGLSWLNG